MSDRFQAWRDVRAMRWTGDNKSAIEDWAAEVAGGKLGRWPLYSVGDWLLLTAPDKKRGPWNAAVMDDKSFRGFFEPAGEA